MICCTVCKVPEGFSVWNLHFLQNMHLLIVKQNCKHSFVKVLIHE